MILNSGGYFEIWLYIASIGFVSLKNYCKLFVFCLCLSYLCYVNQYIKAMKNKYFIICMGFDGEYVKESPMFETIEQAADYSNNLGSKWYFYPFHFTCVGKSIAEAWHPFEGLKGKRIATVVKAFKKASEDKITEGMDCDTYVWHLFFNNLLPIH